MSAIVSYVQKSLSGWFEKHQQSFSKLSARKQYQLIIGIPLFLLVYMAFPNFGFLILMIILLVKATKDIKKSFQTRRTKTNILSTQSNITRVEDLLSNDKGIFIGRADKSGNRDDLRISEENRGLVIGPPGTGKTTFLISQILDWASQSRSFIVIDYKPEIFDLISNRNELRGHRIVRVNPLDISADKYNPLSEVDDEMSLAELATAFFPEKNEENAIFTTYSRMIFEAVSLHLISTEQSNGVGQINAFIRDQGGIKKTLEELENSSFGRSSELAQSILEVSDNERFFASVMATFNEAMNIISYPSISKSLSESDVSLEMFSKFPTAFIIQLPESKKEVLAPLAAFYITHILTWLIEHTDRNAVALFLDEIGNATKIPALVEKMNTVRSRKLPVWTYWQSVEQMQIYGQKIGEGANKILAACDFQMYFRLNDNKTAEQVSQAIGLQDVDYVSSGVIEIGATKNIQREAILEPGELREIEEGRAVCLYRGMKWIGWAEPYYLKYIES